MFTAQSPTFLNSQITAIPSPFRVFHVPTKHVQKSGRIRRTQNPVSGSWVTGILSIRAVINSGEKNVGNVAPPLMESNGLLTSLSPCVDVRAVIKIRKKMKESLIQKIENGWESFINGIEKGIKIQLISEEIDPVTNTGKSVESSGKDLLPRPSKNSDIVEYASDFSVPFGFGNPAAILITNIQAKEFYLIEIEIHGFKEGPIFFPANSWIHSQNDNPESRIIFRNQTYLPSETPEGLKNLRIKDLQSKQGNGKGERKPFERIYDYAPYNDLGNPEKLEDLARPVLSGKERPYPRRCRTGRPPIKSDPNSESRTEKAVYVPRDETYGEVKEESLSAGQLKVVFHSLIPYLAAKFSSSDKSFKSFSDIDELYNFNDPLKNEEQNGNLGQLLERLLKYEIPAIISRDKLVWLQDSEFARQTLAGANPVSIERLTEFPICSKLDPAVYGPPDSVITRELIEQELQGMSIEEAIKNQRLFILDYHDILLPLIEKINSLPGRKAYASRTVFFYTESGTLKPIAIELSLPPTPSSPNNKLVYTSGCNAETQWIWKLAKAHVSSNDSNIHQIVNHWTRTHACVEPYIIATHRQLSSMHPIYKLLHPHMRYTLETNAIARQSFINAEGNLETLFGLGKYSMELSSEAYKKMWRFDMEGLPSDLIRRGMATEDPSMPCGVRLVIEDYPYAADGLLIWSAIKECVEDYVTHFYSKSDSILSDGELQAWWNEIKNKGHSDKQNEPWWPKLETKEDLLGILTTIIWVSSGQHTAMNFGLYGFGGYVPNRPTRMRKFIPQEDDPDYENFLQDPETTFLSSLPTQLQAIEVMGTLYLTSTHAPDEEYLGQLQNLPYHFINDPRISGFYKKFSSRLEEIEEIINKRNKDIHLKNRSGADITPYELLLPSSGPGVTGRGVPNSITT